MFEFNLGLGRPVIAEAHSLLGGQSEVCTKQHRDQVDVLGGRGYQA